MTLQPERRCGEKPNEEDRQSETDGQKSQIGKLPIARPRARRPEAKARRSNRQDDAIQESQRRQERARGEQRGTRPHLPAEVYGSAEHPPVEAREAICESVERAAPEKRRDVAEVD